MSRVKKVLCIQDLSCIGRASLAVAAPIISAMGIQACMLPCALLSTHFGGLGTPAMRDESAFLKDAFAHYTALELTFDAVYSGYLASAAQVNFVAQCFAQNPDALKVVDPVMADGGALYAGVTPEYCRAVDALCGKADAITPNVTESALLCGLAPSDAAMTNEELELRLVTLQRRYPAAHLIVITGVHLVDGKHGNACFWPNGAPRFLSYDPVAQKYPGTGDIFASILTGGLLRNGSAMVSIRLAANFIRSAAAATLEAKTDPRYGVLFEPLLYKLLPKEALQ
ncbi:MAG: pyridoxamine kinase [Ruthenibacterium sp.]